MPRKVTDAGEVKLAAASKPGGRRATGRSFLLTITLACLATLFVIIWTVHTSQEKRGHVGPAGFQM